MSRSHTTALCDLGYMSAVTVIPPLLGRMKAFFTVCYDTWLSSLLLVERPNPVTIGKHAKYPAIIPIFSATTPSLVGPWKPWHRSHSSSIESVSRPQSESLPLGSDLFFFFDERLLARFLRAVAPSSRHPWFSHSARSSWLSPSVLPSA